MLGLKKKEFESDYSARFTAHAHNKNILGSMRSVFFGKCPKGEMDLLDTFEDQKQWSNDQVKERLRNIKILLRGIDFRSIRPLRAIIAGNATEADKKELNSLEECAQRLRKEAANLAMELVDETQES